MLVNQILLTLISISISQLKNYTKAYLVWDLTSFLPPLPSPAEDAGCLAVQSTPLHWDLLKEVYLLAVHSQQPLKGSNVHPGGLTSVGDALRWDDWINCFLNSFFHSAAGEFHPRLYHDVTCSWTLTVSAHHTSSKWKQYLFMLQQLQSK